MDAQDVIQESRLTRVRELNWQIDKLRAENAALRDENAALKAHFDLALVAAKALEKGPLEIWDGWNLILGAQKEARDRDDLLAQAKKAVAGDPALRVWIVLDGRDENVTLPAANIRVSYTGGTGEHRADKFICDYLRMAKYLGLADRVSVRTHDKDFAKTVARLKAEVL